MLFGKCVLIFSSSIELLIDSSDRVKEHTHAKSISRTDNYFAAPKASNETRTKMKNTQKISLKYLNNICVVRMINKLKLIDLFVVARQKRLIFLRL